MVNIFDIHLKCFLIALIYVVWNCWNWIWLEKLEAGVPQGSVLGPLLFLVYINDLMDNITSEMRLFADDSSLFTCVKGINETHKTLGKDLHIVWLGKPMENGI